MVYVDNIILTGNHEPSIERFLTSLNTEFAITDLGKLYYVLGLEVFFFFFFFERVGLEVCYTSNGLFLSQSKYAHDILSRAGLLDSKLVGTPLSTNDVFTTNDNLFHDPTLY